jgi:hypothetical protein
VEGAIQEEERGDGMSEETRWHGKTCFGTGVVDVVCRSIKCAVFTKFRRSRIGIAGHCNMMVGAATYIIDYYYSYDRLYILVCQL